MMTDEFVSTHRPCFRAPTFSIIRGGGGADDAGGAVDVVIWWHLRGKDYHSMFASPPPLTFHAEAAKLLADLPHGGDYDALILVTHHPTVAATGKALGVKSLETVLAAHASADAGFDGQVSLLITDHVPGRRLIYAPTGPLNRHYDDVRRYADVGKAAVRRAHQAGAHRPLVAFLAPPSSVDYAHAVEVCLWGMYQELYTSLEEREWAKKKGRLEESKVHSIGYTVVGGEAGAVGDVSRYVHAVESGRVVARDIIAGDPERMAPPRAVEYLEHVFKPYPNIQVTVIRDVDVLAREYPLLHAVARASLRVPRHAPAVVKLEYRSPMPANVAEHLFLTGKGITYDTGGSDLKQSGHQRGMSRDKGGAAGIAGFMRTVAELQPQGVNISCSLAFVRNSIGSNGYVADEVIVSRAGVRVLVGNTDAEGRMVMTDLLAEHKEQVLAIQKQASSAPRCRCFTVATLTGHVIRAYGDYPACMDIGVAKRHQTSTTLASVGTAFGEPWEISTVRRDDYDFVKPVGGREDVIQCNTAPSTMTSRGHQFPAAFMAIASGVEGTDVAYTHCDIAGAAEEPGPSSGSLPKVTGAPVVTLAGVFLKQ